MLFDIDKLLSKQFKYTENKHGYNGVMCIENVPKDTIILEFPLSNEYMFLSRKISDNPIYESLKGRVDQANIQVFDLALSIFSKYNDIKNKGGYNPEERPFLFNEKQLSLLQNTAIYTIIHQHRHTFDDMFLEYAKLNAVTYDIEQKLREVYNYCQSYSFGLELNKENFRVIHPSIYINHCNYDEGSPKLIHKVIDGKYCVFTEKEYVKGEEILDCYTSNAFKIFHKLPINNHIVINDWRLIMACHYGILEDLVDDEINPNNKELKEKQIPQGCKITDASKLINKDILILKDIVVDQFDIDKFDIDEDPTKWDKQTEVALQLRGIEMNHVLEFCEKLLPQSVE
jgi:hypothetical protein